MNTHLSDAELDELLDGASRRLMATTARLAVGAAPAPTSVVARRVVGLVAVVAIVAGGIAIGGRRPGVSLPPGYTNGEHGTEIRLVEVDDGDGRDDTILLRAEPTGGHVTIKRGVTVGPSIAMPTTIPGSSEPPTSVVVPQQTFDVCIESFDGSGICGAELIEPFFMGSRGVDGQALVVGVPDDVVVVSFVSGPIRHWQRPVHGVAVFPFSSEASTAALAILVRSDGTETEELRIEAVSSPSPMSPGAP